MHDRMFSAIVDDMMRRIAKLRDAVRKGDWEAVMTMCDHIGLASDTAYHMASIIAESERRRDRDR